MTFPRRIGLSLAAACMMLLCAARAQAQDVRVTINLPNSTLSKVMDSIERQTRYLFSPAAGVDVEQTVSISVTETPVATVLNQLSSATGLDFNVHIR